MFFSKSRVLKKVSKENIKVIEIYKKSGKVFQLYCDASKAHGTRGFNVNYCINMLTINGFVNLIDNKTLDIPDVKFEENKEEKIILDIEECFSKFKEYADLIV